MKIIIIGSKGFIGSYLSRYFTQLNSKVFECDVIVDYNAASSYFLCDASNTDYTEIFQSIKFDLCINCSGAASVPDSLIDPLRDFKLNVENVYKILESIRKYNSECRFINISSAAVYGNPKKLPIQEGDKTEPISPYGIHKQMSESICSEFYTYFGVKTCSLRIFSAYGEGLKKQLFWDLYKKSINSYDIKMFGTGDETRDFIYIKDIARIVTLVTQKADFKGETLNIANSSEVKIKDAVNQFLELINYEGKLIFSGKERKGDPIKWQADISTIKSFGYKQETNLTDGLKNYIKWLKESI